MANAARVLRQGSLESSRPQLRVIEGNGNDAKVRKAHSINSLGVLKVLCIVAIFIFSIGAARIAFSAQTVSVLLNNNNLKAEIKLAQARGDDLQVQQSIFANPDRIERIAADNLGMVAARTVADLDISHGSKLIKDVKTTVAQTQKDESLQVVR
ncbi:MAG: hypothetical protein Q4E22_04810 [Coriobacteriia bacterium]|nr:hypothetical protein [Coriobacteriia bacterium]